MQYTLRNIPEALDEALRERARSENKSLNQVAIEALSRALGLRRRAVRHRDLADLAGRWREDPDFDQAIADQDRVDEELWK
jgi:hypothetical protein